MRALEDQTHVRVAGDLEFESLALVAERPGRIECGFAHQPAVITGSPSTRACQRNRRAATVPAAIGSTSESISAVATATSWVVLISGSMRNPMWSATMRTDILKPDSRMAAIGPRVADSGVPPKPMMWRTTSGEL